MKLSNVQADALAETIINKHNAELQAKREALIKSPAVQKQAKEMVKRLNAINKELEGMGYFVDGLGWNWKEKSEAKQIEQIAGEIARETTDNEKMSEKNSRYDRYELKNKIVIASIDAETMQELTKKLGIVL